MNNPIEETPRIEILPMPQRSQIQNQTEDWTGTSNTLIRRRLQNRLNQRASRQRRKLDPRRLEGPTKIMEAQYPKIVDPFTTRLSKGEMHKVHIKHILSSETFNAYLTNLCIPPDSYLLSLLHYNVARALITNVKILKLPIDRMEEDDILSPFNTSSPPTQLPATLQPTRLQIEIAHHPELDIFPFPPCRDNFLSAIAKGHVWDDVEFCRDIMYGVEGTDGRTGLIVWGDPWVAGSWEVEENFARKWAWSLKGCTDLFESTNKWRDRRGEMGLVFEEVL
ncbi:bcd6379c-0892-4025-bbd3-db92c6c568ca [Sclerotinia trifoliorum]|uniref:Bcd6379c-0892-4025-bbd3-db92c6c568ca n=1 Tax=Sclerotinia trifoliorum TaxID=28548 RepID=A0A8H2W029_9HELO|nr:bcd6379c-0892-4025-bbd3-db92c6c568ca [Sclerotinia trifoliorum]